MLIQHNTSPQCSPRLVAPPIRSSPRRRIDDDVASRSGDCGQDDCDLFFGEEEEASLSNHEYMPLVERDSGLSRGELLPRSVSSARSSAAALQRSVSSERSSAAALPRSVSSARSSAAAVPRAAAVSDSYCSARTDSLATAPATAIKYSTTDVCTAPLLPPHRDSEALSIHRDSASIHRDSASVHRHSASVHRDSASASADGPTRDCSDQQHEDHSRLKCVLVGDGAVGKTSLVVSYATNGYPSEYRPTTFDNYNVVVTVDGKPITLQLCDIAGQEFDRLRPVWYANTDVFLVCFSVVSPSSFHNVLQKWVPEIRKHQPLAAVVLVGTQSDLRSNVQVLIELSRVQQQPVSEAEARRLSTLLKAAAYVECSALTQRNMKDVFDQCIVSGLSVARRRSSRHSAASPTHSKPRARRKHCCWHRLFCCCC